LTAGTYHHPSESCQPATLVESAKEPIYVGTIADEYVHVLTVRSRQLLSGISPTDTSAGRSPCNTPGWLQRGQRANQGTPESTRILDTLSNFGGHTLGINVDQGERCSPSLVSDMWIPTKAATYSNLIAATIPT
jgi:hypothetical protein